MRLGTALGFQVDPEYFGSDVGWVLLAKLEELMNANRRLDPVSLQVLAELGIALGIRADASTAMASLERELGSSPFPAQTITAVVVWVRGQLNFAPVAKKVELDPGSAQHVPLKNYDFE